MEKEYYSVTEVAAILGIMRGTVRKLIKEGEIPARRIGFKFYVPKSFVEEKEK